MTYKKIVISALVCLAALHAQTSIYVGGGPSLQSGLPRGAVNVTVGFCTHDTGSCALVNYAARGTVDDFRHNAMVYSTSAGFRQVIGRATSNTGIVDLFILANSGAAITPVAAGFAGAAGGGLTFHPGKAPNWGFSCAAQGEYSPVTPGWRPNLFIQAGYTFGAIK